MSFGPQSGGSGGDFSGTDGASPPETGSGVRGWLASIYSRFTGGVTIGTVNQGTGGNSAWKTDSSATTQPVSIVAPPTSTTSNVASSITSVTLLAANAARRGAMIHNDSASVLYAKLGSAASATSFTVKLLAGDFYELPIVCYSGIITGIWVSADGAARVTEIV